MNTSRSSICHPYAKSATERNFSERANSRKASVTLKVFIQPPDLGNFCNIVGNMAKSENGSAKAKAKPSIPIVGASSDLPAASTSSVPMIGPVQLNDTMTSVKAMKRMERKPVVADDLADIFVLHDDGSVSSKAPKNEAANTTRMRKKMILTTALVESALSADAPKMAVMSRPRPT